MLRIFAIWSRRFHSCFLASQVILHALRREQPNLYRTVIGATVVTILSGVFLLPSSGYWHKNFCLSPLKFKAEAAEYIEQNAPARVMVEYLNRMAPGEPAAFFSNGIAGLLGRPYTSGSHTFEFFRLCEAAGSAEAVKKLMATHSIRYFVTPSRELRRAEHAAARGLCQTLHRRAIPPGMRVRGRDEKRRSRQSADARRRRIGRALAVDPRISGCPRQIINHAVSEIRSWPSWLVLSAAGVPAQTTPAPAGPVQPPALTALNNAFRAAYADAKSRVLAVLRSDSDRQRR